MRLPIKGLDNVLYYCKYLMLGAKNTKNATHALISKMLQILSICTVLKGTYLAQISCAVLSRNIQGKKYLTFRETGKIICYLSSGTEH